MYLGKRLLAEACGGCSLGGEYVAWREGWAWQGRGCTTREFQTRASRTCSAFCAAGTFSTAESSGNVRAVDIVYEHPDVVCAKREPVFVIWWRRTPTLPQATAAFENLQVSAKAFAGGVCVVVVVGDDVGQPDRASTELFSKSMRVIERHVLAEAFIMEGTGLKATAVRTGLRAIQTMSRAIFPITIAPTVDEGMMFLAKKTGFINEQEAREMIVEIAQIRTSRGATKKP